jgi:cell division protein ZapB
MSLTSPLSSSSLPAMAPSFSWGSLIERVEHLLLRYQEMQRAQQLLQDELARVKQENESLHLRLSASRSRVDTLLERLPENHRPL